MSKPAVPQLTQWSKITSLTVPLAGGYFGRAGDNLVYSGGTTWVDGTKHWLANTHILTGVNGWEHGPALPRSLAYGSCAQSPRGMEIYGGTDGSHVYRDCWRLDSSGAGWEHGGEMPQAMLLSQAAIVDGRVFLLGGAVDAALSTFTDRVWIREASHWQMAGKLPHGSIAVAASVAAGDRHVYFFGGCTTGPEGAVNYGEAWQFDAHSMRWERVRPLPHPARALAAVELDDRHILLAGGYYGSEGVGFSNQCFIYDCETDIYRDAPGLPVGLAGAAMVRSGDVVYLCGGEPQMRARSPLLLRAQLSRS